MKRPEDVTLSREEGEALLARLAANTLTAEDRQVLGKVLTFYFWLLFALREAKLSLKRLKALVFGEKPKPPKPPSLGGTPSGGSAGGSAPPPSASPGGHSAAAASPPEQKPPSPGSSPLIPVNSVRQQTRHFVELGQPRIRAVARQGDRAGADGAAHESGVVQTH
jgi:hypothetical protein